MWKSFCTDKQSLLSQTKESHRLSSFHPTLDLTPISLSPSKLPKAAAVNVPLFVPAAKSYTICIYRIWDIKSDRLLSNPQTISRTNHPKYLVSYFKLLFSYCNLTSCGKVKCNTIKIHGCFYLKFVKCFNSHKNENYFAILTSHGNLVRREIINTSRNFCEDGISISVLDRSKKKQPKHSETSCQIGFCHGRWRPISISYFNAVWGLSSHINLMPIY